ncbi:MAG: ComF family protein [Acidobacteriaceae bacterium]|nr:ComF family protein [Acidobacteriaceae bacterium]
MDSYPLDEHDLCTVCRESMVNFDACYSFGSFDGPLQKLIHLYKYGKIESLARPLSRLLVQALPACETVDMVVAMPMHWRKQWERGFNQAALLAEPLARRLRVPLAGNLRRTRYTKSQAGLDESERKANLKDSFLVRRPAMVVGKRLLLIDDVFTTGATLRAASEALKKAGAARVAALTLARVDRRSFSPSIGPRKVDTVPAAKETEGVPA